MAEELSNWRAEIDKIDSEIVRLLDRRIVLSEEIGRFKIGKGLDIDNGPREREILDRIMGEGKLEPEFIKELFGVIFRESKKVQERLKE